MKYQIRESRPQTTDAFRGFQSFIKYSYEYIWKNRFIIHHNYICDNYNCYKKLKIYNYNFVFGSSDHLHYRYVFKFKKVLVYIKLYIELYFSPSNNFILIHLYWWWIIDCYRKLPEIINDWIVSTHQTCVSLS